MNKPIKRCKSGLSQSNTPQQPQAERKIMLLQGLERCSSSEGTSYTVGGDSNNVGFTRRRLKVTSRCLSPAVDLVLTGPVPHVPVVNEGCLHWQHGCKIHHQNLGPATLAAEAVLITTSSLLLENRSQHSQEKSSVV
ncbi:hypothetical protein BaRGS_00036979 [Batillaria attramentaria]|uniref:Uncharacterized protein n=1 Tax=Batillaria attramentaria TaxID=370345 RepID=A0ABD0JAC8_9CAEN